MKDLFGEMFDFNGDGETDCVEEAIGLSIFEEMFGEDEDDDSSQEDDDEDIFLVFSADS